MRTRLASLLAAGIALTAAGPILAVAPSLTSIGLLDQDSRASSAFGVSPDGSVVVGSSRPLSLTRAVKWTAASGMSAIPGTGNFSEAYGASTAGAAIVGKDGDLGFRWTAATGTVSLGDLPGGLNSSVGFDVSADGSVVVGHSGISGGTEAFRWTLATGITGIGELPGGGTYSSASGISADGAVIVGTSTSGSGDEAFRYTAATGMVGLGDLPGSSFLSQAFAVSADGSVIVGNSASSTGFEAFRWTAATGMVGLGVWPGGENPISEASDVSADGSVIVGSAFTERFEAVVWRNAGDIERLWDVLLAAGVNPAANGWSNLQSASAVSDDGLTIVGTGQRGGQTVGFVAVIPEPTSLALLVLAAMATTARRRRFAHSRAGPRSA